MTMEATSIGVLSADDLLRLNFPSRIEVDAMNNTMNNPTLGFEYLIRLCQEINGAYRRELLRRKWILE